MKILSPDMAARQAIGLDTAHAARPGAPKATPQEKQAAKEFEAIFLRKMLACIEKSSKVEGSSMSGGADAYSSMIVGALADAVSAAGGIGLGDSVLRSIQASHAYAEPHAKKALPTGASPESDTTAQGSQSAAVHEVRKGQE